MLFRSAGQILLIVGGMLLLMTLNLGFARREEARNHWIVYRSESHARSGYYRMRLDGSEKERLDRIPPGSVKVEISPDGRWIAYLRVVDLKSQIFRMRPDGSRNQRLTAGHVDVLDMEWSSDSRQIMYATSADEQSPLFVMDADGSNLRQLPALADNIFEMLWSPDEEWLLVRDYAGMIRLRLDGSESRAVAPDSIARAGDWSPDGEDIVFAAAHQTRYEQLYRISLQDGFVRQLTDDSILHEQISYSPDGRWIVYSYSTGQGSIIFRMRADGSDNRQLTGQDSSDGFPQWFPIIDLVLREWLLIAIGTVMSVVGLWRMYVI